MNVEDLIYDIREIKELLENDSDISNSWILHKINSWRAIHIANEFSLTQEINPQWLQRVHKQTCVKTTAADDPSITYNSITLGKATIPETIKLNNDLGTYRISGSASIVPLEPVNFNQLMLYAEFNELEPGAAYYSKIGNDIYIYPHLMEISAIIIAENPMDVKVNDNGTLRNRTYKDEYPLDNHTAQKVILDFLTKDMAIKEGTISDIINDAQNQFKILKDEEKIRS